MSLKSPLLRDDIEVPTDPEGRVINPINEEAINQGCDYNGQRAPWEVNEKEDVDGPIEEEDSLPSGIAPIPPVVPITKIVAPKNIQSTKWEI